MAEMAGTGAIPAVALSKVCAVMPWARASLRAWARKASNLASPVLGGAGGGGGGATTTGCSGAAGLGGLVAQPAIARTARRVAMGFKRLLEPDTCDMPHGYTASRLFWRKSRLFGCCLQARPVGDRTTT